MMGGMAKRNLQDKVIIITGASAGIGAATAIEAAQASMHVVVAARRLDKLEAVAAKVRECGCEALPVVTDVADAQQVDNLVDQTMDKFGRVNVMFANAGYGSVQSVVNLTDEEHRRLFDVNYFGTVYCVKAAARVMKPQGSGHIVITSSISARVSLPYHAPYSATKAAQLMLAQGLIEEMRPHNIDVTSVHPILTTTEFFDPGEGKTDRREIVKHSPKFFVQTPQHVAKRVVKALRKPVPEVWPARWSRWGAGLATLTPGMTLKSLRKHAEKDREMMREMGQPLD